MEDANNRFESLFNHASMGIVVVNSNGLIQSVNPFAVRLFGYSTEEILNKPIEVLIPQRYHHKHVDHRDNYIHHPKVRPMGVGMDLFAIKKDGTEFPVEVSLGNYQSAHGAPFAIAFISDISVRKKAEAEIVKLNDELEATVEQRTSDLQETLKKLEVSSKLLKTALDKEKELSELKSRFVSMASHEFRTPLSTILSSAYLIEKYQNLEEQVKREKHLDRIVSSVNMLTETLNDFLSVEKIEEGKIQVRPSEFDIEQFIKEIIEEIINTLKTNQKINYQHSGPGLVNMDKSLLKHIAHNLISNASKFSPESSEIQISTQVSDKKLLLTVRDFGIGISSEDQKHLMDPFFRGSNVINIQGTGLGLHIVAKYVELMNGKIQFESKLEEGTIFKITFNL